MTALGSTDELVPARTGSSRLVTVAVTIFAVMSFVMIANRVLNEGYIRLDITALQSGAVWKSGGWLSQLVLSSVAFVPSEPLRQSLLSFMAAVATGVMLGMLFHRLRAMGWTLLGATLVVMALGSNLLVLRGVTGSSLSLPVFVALAALLPAALRVESVGDVQAAISLGLTLPLMLLAGPATTPLIVPIALLAALADRDARRDFRAFIAMVLVAALPSLIVAIGVFGFAVQANVDLAALLLPYFAAYRPVAAFNAGEFAVLALYAPVLLVPLIHCLRGAPGTARRGALAVVALPLYLVGGGMLFSWPLPQWGPPMALLSAFASWLAVTRLDTRTRVLAALLLMLSNVASWVLPPLWNDPTWQAAIHGLLPHIVG